MEPYSSLALAGSIIFWTAVILGLGALAACVALTVAHQVEQRNRRRSRAMVDRITPYMKPGESEIDAAFRRQAEARRGR